MWSDYATAQATKPYLVQGAHVWGEAAMHAQDLQGRKMGRKQSSSTRPHCLSEPFKVQATPLHTAQKKEV